LYHGASLFLSPAVKMDLVEGDVGSDLIALTGVFEHKKAKRLVGMAKKGGTLVDFGANLGFFSLLWASFNKTNRILAFEASPRNIPRLSTTVVSNREALARVFCNGKLWRRPGASSAIGTIPERPWDPAPWSRAVGPAACGSPGMTTAPDVLHRPVFLGGPPATLRNTASTACASSDNVT